MASKQQGRRFGRPKFSTVIALLALFAALGGSAYAAKEVINGKNIKKNSIKSKAVKNGTLKTKDLSAAAQSDLQGQKGAKGDTGPQGPQGPQGPAGTNGTDGTDGTDGVVEPVAFSNDTGVNLADGVTLGVGVVSATPGTEYVVNAKVQAFGGVGVTQLDCSLTRGGTEIDRASWNPPANSTRTALPLQGVTGDAGGTITIGCGSDGGTSSVSFRRITAIPVG